VSPTARRVVGLVVVAVAVAVGCTFAGFWQWHRGEDRERAVRILVANFSAEPVAIDALLDSPAATLATTDAWRPVTLTGRYAEGSTVLLRNRPVAGTPSFHLLAPFTVEAPGSDFDGAVLVIDRGWVPMGADASAAASVPEPPPGTVAVEVRLRPAERASTRGAPAGQAHSIAPGPVVAAAGIEHGPVVANAYGSLVEEVPAPTVVPGALALPSTDYGPHRSYAMQWWVFALGALAGFGMLAYREWRGPRSDGEDADDGAPTTTAPTGPAGPTDPGRAGTGDTPPAKPRRQRRRPTAEEEEDALIDAQASETRSR